MAMDRLIWSFYMSRAEKALPHWIPTLTLLCFGVAALRALARVGSGNTPAAFTWVTFGVHLALLLFCAAIVASGCFLWLRLGGRHQDSHSRRFFFATVTGPFLLYGLLSFEVGWHNSKGAQGHPIWNEIWAWIPGVLVLLLTVATFTQLSPKRRPQAAAALVLALIAALGFTQRSAEPQTVAAVASRASRELPPVIVILIDTLRADHLGIYGYPLPTSPEIDHFGQDALVFDRAFSTAPWTRPACASLMTSRLPSELGIRDKEHGLPKDVPVWAEWMAREGYRTSAIVANVQAGPVFGFDRGFIDFDIGPSYLRYTGARVALSRLRLIDYRDIYPRYNAEQLTSRAIGLLNRRDKSQPPFLYLHYADPHGPYAPPKEEDRWREFASAEAAALKEPPFSPFFGDQEVEGLALEAMIARYDAEIAYLDRHLGRLFQYLKDENLYDSSWIVVTSDHGEEFQDHGGWTHGGSLYNELIRIPMLIKFPAGAGRPSGRAQENVGLMDLLPTARDLLGARWPTKDMRGRSLLRSPEPEPQRQIYAEASGKALLRAAIQGPHKLIQHLSPSGEVTAEHYFSLDLDINEKHPKPPAEALPENQLDFLRDWLRAGYTLGESQSVELDQETRQELRALGYID